MGRVALMEGGQQCHVARRSDTSGVCRTIMHHAMQHSVRLCGCVCVMQGSAHECARSWRDHPHVKLSFILVLSGSVLHCRILCLCLCLGLCLCGSVCVAGVYAGECRLGQQRIFCMCVCVLRCDCVVVCATVSVPVCVAHVLLVSAMSVYVAVFAALCAFIA